MANLTSGDDGIEKFLVKGMEDYMAQEAKKITERHLKEIETELNEARTRMVTNVVINISKQMEMHTLGDRIIFEIRKVNGA